MKGVVQKINDTFKEKKLYYIIVLLFFCIGIVLGAYTVKCMNLSDKTDLANYFTSFVDGFKDRSIDYGALLLDVIKKNAYLIIPIFLLGFTFFGSPIILLIDLIKGFSLGYTFTFLIISYEGKGLMLALASIIPQNIIYIPCFIALSVIAIEMTNARFRFKFSKKSVPKNAYSAKGIGNYLVIIACFFVVGVMLETYAVPSIIKFVVSSYYG